MCPYQMVMPWGFPSQSSTEPRAPWASTKPMPQGEALPILHFSLKTWALRSAIPGLNSLAPPHATLKTVFQLKFHEGNLCPRPLPCSSMALHNSHWSSFVKSLRNGHEVTPGLVFFSTLNPSSLDPPLWTHCTRPFDPHSHSCLNPF